MTRLLLDLDALEEMGRHFILGGLNPDLDLSDDYLFCSSHASNPYNEGCILRHVEGNPAMRNPRIFPALRQVGQDLVLSTKLPVLRGAFGQLETVGGDFYITRSGLVRITNQDFPSLTMVEGDLVITSNLQLRLLEGFSALTWVGGDIHLGGNPGRTQEVRVFDATGEFLVPITSPQRDLLIWYDIRPLGVAPRPHDGLMQPGSLLNPKLRCIAGLDELECVGGDLRLRFHGLDSDILDLNTTVTPLAFEPIGPRSIEGELFVGGGAGCSPPYCQRNEDSLNLGSPGLEELVGPRQLQQADGLKVTGNEALTHIALNLLERLEGDLAFQQEVTYRDSPFGTEHTAVVNNPRLVSASFPNLDSVGGAVIAGEVDISQASTSYEVLHLEANSPTDAFVDVTDIGELYMDEVQSLAPGAFSNLRSVGHLEVTQTALTDLPFPALEEVDTLLLSQNEDMQQLHGLTSLRRIGTLMIGRVPLGESRFIPCDYQLGERRGQPLQDFPPLARADLPGSPRCVGLPLAGASRELPGLHRPHRGG